MNIPEIEIYTDGSCSRNPGPGGWSAILRYPAKNYEKEFAGYEPYSTNNRMELTAVIEGLKALKTPAKVTVFTDSRNACTTIGNIEKMEKRGWRTTTGARLANLDLLKEFKKVKDEGKHTVYFQHIPGHSGNTYNERCDVLAKEQIRINGV